MKHEWTEARRAFPGPEVTPSESVAWAADQAGLWMDGELIGFPEAGREILRLAERKRRLREMLDNLRDRFMAFEDYFGVEDYDAAAAADSLLKEE